MLPEGVFRGSERPAELWSRISGLYVTLGVLLTIDLFARMLEGITNPTPIVLIAVVYATFIGGIRVGLLSGGLSMAYLGYFFSEPGQLFVYGPEALQRLVVTLLAVPAMVVMVGALKIRERRSRELELTATRLRELDEMKTQFLNNAAHELRTPLTPIKMQMHLLKHSAFGEHDERHRRALAMMDRNVERLNALVQDLLEVSRLQAGRLQVQMRRIDAHRLAVEAVESFHESAVQEGVTLELRSTPGLWVDADPKRIIQVLFNLLTNALKFTPRGGRIVVAADAMGGMVVVRVHDTGIGLPPEALNRLFLPFSQVHAPEQAKQPGSGLGLFICKGILDQHGGRIWAESPGPGRGTTLAISLPRALALDLDGPAGEAVLADPLGEPRRKRASAPAPPADEAQAGGLPR